MGGHNENPYRSGSNFNKLFQFWMSDKKGIATRDELVKHGVEIMTLSPVCALSTVNTMLSPQDIKLHGTIRGSVLGNPCAKGEIYFAERKRKEKVGDDKRFRLRWRSEADVASLKDTSAERRRVLSGKGVVPAVPVAPVVPAPIEPVVAEAPVVAAPVAEPVV